MRDTPRDVQSTWQVSGSSWVLPKYKLRTSTPDETAPWQLVLPSFALWYFECFTNVLKEQNGLILKIKTSSSLNGSLSRPRVVGDVFNLTFVIPMCIWTYNSGLDWITLAFVRDVLQTRRISTQRANHFFRAGHFHFSYRIIPAHMLFNP